MSCELEPPGIFSALMIAQMQRGYGKYRHRYNPQDSPAALLTTRDDKQRGQKSSETDRYAP